MFCFAFNARTSFPLGCKIELLKSLQTQKNLLKLLLSYFFIISYWLYPLYPSYDLDELHF